MAKWYERNPIYDLRCAVGKGIQLPVRTSRHPLGAEKAMEFWARVEKNGRLVEAVALYDRLEAEAKAWAKVPRETKQQFAQRIEREGRQAEAESVRAELLASGLSEREAQVELVARLQPLDGSKTRAWETPDPWQAGRLFRKEADGDKWSALADGVKEEDRKRHEARNRVWAARYRRDERVALAAARKQARALKTPARDCVGSQEGQKLAMPTTSGR